MSEDRKIIKGNYEASQEIRHNKNEINYATIELQMDNNSNEDQKELKQDSFQHSSNNEGQDIAEEQEGSNSGIQIAYTKASHKNPLFHNSEIEIVNTKEQNEILNIKNPVQIDSIQESSQIDKVSLLEESQEVVMFNSDSKLSSPNNSLYMRKDS